MSLPFELPTNVFMMLSFFLHFVTVSLTCWLKGNIVSYVTPRSWDFLELTLCFLHPLATGLISASEVAGVKRVTVDFSGLTAAGNLHTVRVPC